MKKYLALLLAMLLALSLTACGGKATPSQENPSSQPETTDPGQETPGQETPGQATPQQQMPQQAPQYLDLAPHRQELPDKGAICGVLFVGTVEDPTISFVQSPDYLVQLLKQSGYLIDFNFMTDIPSQRIAEASEGYEVYCFFPLDDDAHVTVSSCDIDVESGEVVDTGEKLLDSNSGEPFLVHCNSSDLYSNVRVTVTDSQGHSFTWEPHLSLKDGTVDIPEDITLLYDATLYEFTHFQEG